MQEKDLSLKIDNFEGPLDLLLSLVKEKKMDIFEINLSELASEYLKLIQTLKENDINLAGEYLVMAATLIQIKAKLLLETPSDKEELQEDEKKLLERLVEYQQFKKISEELRKKEYDRTNFFIKETESYDDFQYPEDETRLDGSSDPIKMIMALRKMFERINAQKLRETTIEKFNLSPAERRLEIIEILLKNPNPTFEQIFSVPSMNHFVVTMLTVLDMARKQELKIEQKEQYGTIKFAKGVINE